MKVSPAETQRTVAAIAAGLWTPASWRWTLLASALVFLVALTCHTLISTSQPIFLDELFGHLAANALRTEGAPRIYEGFYTRASAYTRLIAAITPSSNIIIERLPAAVFGALLISTTFAWVSRRVSFAAALCAASMLALSDVSLKLSGYVRFYTLHALLIFLSAVVFYEAFRTKRAPIVRIGGLLAALVMIALAAHLQPTTIIFVLALGAWLVGLTVFMGRHWLSAHLRLASISVALLGVVGLIALFAAWNLGLNAILTPAVEEFFNTSAWNQANSSSPSYYFVALLDSLPGLLLVLPIAIYFALRVAPGMALISSVIFACCFAILSFGGMKNERYLFFAMPFFYITLGIGVSEVVRRLTACVAALQAEATPAEPRWEWESWRKRLAAPCLVMSVAGALACNPSLVQGASLILQSAKTSVQCSGCLDRTLADGAWTDGEAALREQLSGQPIILTTDPFRAVHYLGRYDAAVVSSIKPPYEEFVLDPRSGRPSISRAESLAKIQACYDEGIVLLTNKSWPDPSRISESFQRQLERTTSFTMIKGKGNNIFAFAWRRPRSGAPTVACLALAERLKHHAAGDPEFSRRPQFIP